MNSSYSRFLSIAIFGLALSGPTVRGQCFNNSSAMLEAQIGGTKELIVCPNTTIDIGVPTDFTFANFAGGDLPLTVLGDNVTIKCGEDGKSTNNCVLRGGFVQFATSPIVPQAPGLTITTNNLLVQGLTFTGEMVQIPGAGDTPISLSAPGTNIVFDDIVIENLISMNTFSLEKNVLIPEEFFPVGSTSVTLQNSVFRNISFAYYAVSNKDQTLIIDGVVFDNVFHNPDFIPLDDVALGAVIYASGVEVQLLNSEFTDISFLTAIMVIRGDTEYTIEGNTGSGWIVDEEASFNETNICSDGLIVATSTDGTHFLDPALDSCLELVENGEEPTDPPSSASLLGLNGISVSVLLIYVLFNWCL